jgi:thiamine pyrophosphokinase
MKYLIIGNGDFLPLEVIREISDGCTIIALDGAAERLVHQNITPHYVLGDFDSIHQNFFLDHPDIIKLHRPDQSHTDLHKALHFAKNNQATEIHIICVFSETRLDHSFFNARLLRTEASQQCTLQIHGLGQTLTYAKDSTVIIRGEIGDQCGILAFPEGRFHAEGLVWNGPHDLRFGYSESACNIMAAKQATIHISGEALIIHPPQFASQRKFGLSPILAS